MDLSFAITLGLSYAPISNYDFSILKKEQIMHKLLEHSNLYIISQRPVLYFDNMVFQRESGSLVFKICQLGNPDTLECTLPLYQEEIQTSEDEPVIIEFGSHDRNWQQKADPPVNGVHGIKVSGSDGTFLIWLTPEKVLFAHSHGLLACTIDGNFDNFRKYHVHYVGKATEQNVISRLTGHSTLQDILSLEYPMQFQSLPTHEICLLLFSVAESYGISTLAPDGANQNMQEMRSLRN
jgi:hypothetical protein